MLTLENSKLCVVRPSIVLPFRRTKGVFKSLWPVQTMNMTFPMTYSIGIGCDKRDARERIAKDLKTYMLDTYEYADVAIDQIDRMIMHITEENEKKLGHSYKLADVGNRLFESVVDAETLDDALLNFVSMFPITDLDWKEMDQTWFLKMGPETMTLTKRLLDEALHVSKLIDDRFMNINQMRQLSSDIHSKLTFMKRLNAKINQSDNKTTK